MNELFLTEKSDLYEKYGPLMHLYRMPYEKLVSLEGMNEKELFSILKLQNDFLKTFRESLKAHPISKQNKKFQDYCIVRLRQLKREVCLAFFLDEKDFLITDEIIHVGITNKVAFNEEDIFERAHKHDSSGIILIHNHPSGNIFPSRADKSAALSFFENCTKERIKCCGFLIAAGETITNITYENHDNWIFD